MIFIKIVIGLFNIISNVDYRIEYEKKNSYIVKLSNSRLRIFKIIQLFLIQDIVFSNIDMIFKHFSYQIYKVNLIAPLHKNNIVSRIKHVFPTISAFPNKRKFPVHKRHKIEKSYTYYNNKSQKHIQRQYYYLKYYISYFFNSSFFILLIFISIFYLFRIIKSVIIFIVQNNLWYMSNNTNGSPFKIPHKIYMGPLHTYQRIHSRYQKNLQTQYIHFFQNSNFFLLNPIFLLLFYTLLVLFLVFFRNFLQNMIKIGVTQIKSNFLRKGFKLRKLFDNVFILTIIFNFLHLNSITYRHTV